MMEKITEVDKKDNKIGLRGRDEFYRSRHIHRSSHLLLFNSDNEVLLQKRSPSSRVYPGLYSFSASGTVGEETYEDCIKREMQEEIGISTKAIFLFKHLFFDDVDKAFHSVFVGKIKDGKNINFNKEEVEEVKWISIVKLKEDIEKNPGKYTPNFIEGMKIYFKEHLMI